MIYVLSPNAVVCIDKGECLDMPQLFDELVARRKKTMGYPVFEY